VNCETIAGVQPVRLFRMSLQSQNANVEGLQPSKVMGWYGDVMKLLEREHAVSSQSGCRCRSHRVCGPSTATWPCYLRLRHAPASPAQRSGSVPTDGPGTQLEVARGLHQPGRSPSGPDGGSGMSVVGPLQQPRSCRRESSRSDQPTFNQRAAASAVSSGRVLNAIDVLGAALWTALITVSNSCRLFGGSLRPPPITTQS
jgi:hypothetical protein